MTMAYEDALPLLALGALGAVVVSSAGPGPQAQEPCEYSGYATPPANGVCADGTAPFDLTDFAGNVALFCCNPTQCQSLGLVDPAADGTCPLDQSLVSMTTASGAPVTCCEGAPFGNLIYQPTPGAGTINEIGNAPACPGSQIAANACIGVPTTPSIAGAPVQGEYLLGQICSWSYPWVDSGDNTGTCLCSGLLNQLTGVCQPGCAVAGWWSPVSYVPGILTCPISGNVQTVLFSPAFNVSCCQCAAGSSFSYQTGFCEQ